MKIEDYSIQLNFLPLERQLFNFVTYRLECDDPRQAKPDADLLQYSLPVSPSNPDNRRTYWVSFSEREGFERVSLRARDNHRLTVRFLYHILARSCVESLGESEYIIDDRTFLKEIHFVLHEHREGKECVSVQPYCLRVNDEFGFLLDYSFRRNTNVPFSRRVQRLSLSLDENFRSNKNFYSDRFKRILAFLHEQAQKIFPLEHKELDGEIAVSRHFSDLKASLLNTKTYVFNNGREKNSQFLGLKEHGPLARPKNDPTFVFIFRKEDTDLARYLLRSLRGQTFPYQFPGMAKIFRLDFSNQHIAHVVIPSFAREALNEALSEVNKIVAPAVVPVLVVPGDKDAYYLQKSLFTNSGISTQCITLKILRDERQFKWAIANLALQIFCKAGGRPWLVKPTDSKCLIVGISQTHLREHGEDSRVKKYFAYSVLTDSSGVFQRLSVLARSNDKRRYLQELKSKVVETIEENATEFETIVIHTSFKMRREELGAIKEAIDSLAGAMSERVGLAVIKVNTKNRFFGYCKRHASLVPFESSCMAIGRNEYLVWFEGTQYHNPHVSRALSGPTHIEIIMKTENMTKSDTALLQDLVNLSGGNWRGFNAKSAPVSIYYCQLVGKFIAEFEARELPDSTIENIRPWFI